MGRRLGSTNLTPAIRDAICRGRNQGTTHEVLAKQFQLSTSTVTKVLQSWKIGRGVQKKEGIGRPRITDRLVDRTIVRLSRDNPRLTATDIMKELKDLNLSKASVWTVRRRLGAAGLPGRRPVKKPLISKKNRAARMKFAKEHVHWKSEDWHRVLFSDESKFCLFGSDGIRYVRRPDGCRFHAQYQLPTVKYGGGSVLVWGCFHAGGIGPLRRIRGIMDKNVYVDILEKTMLPFARQVFGRSLLYQQDNDPKHTSGLVKEWFHRHRINLMEWPSQSPDLNPIENLWEELKRSVECKKAKNDNEKYAQLEAAWKSIPQHKIDKLMDSMPRRCQAVINAKGFATKY